MDDVEERFTAARSELIDRFGILNLSQTPAASEFNATLDILHAMYTVDPIRYRAQIVRLLDEFDAVIGLMMLSEPQQAQQAQQAQPMDEDDEDVANILAGMRS